MEFMPLVIIKQHREDPFLLSYQVDGFSLEVNYCIVPQTVQKMYMMLRELMDIVVEAGGRFYLAKDPQIPSIAEVLGMLLLKNFSESVLSR